MSVDNDIGINPLAELKSVDPVTLQLLDAARDTLVHVEDVSAKRSNGECTLCHTYREMLRGAVDAFYKAHPEIIRVEDLPF